jgi:hypothetical protein
MKEGEKKVQQVLRSYSSSAGLYQVSYKISEEKAVRKEAYIYASEIYNPEHPIVLEAGGLLIDTLCRSGDFYDAERFARVCYDSLTRPPLDPEAYEVA